MLAEAPQPELGLAEAAAHINNVAGASAGAQQGATGSNLADHGDID